MGGKGWMSEDRAKAARIAYLAALLHIAAGLAMLFVLRSGLPVPGSTVAERWRWVTAHAWLWCGGWLVWHVAALSLLAFYLVLARRWSGRAPLRCGLALITAGAGLAVDLAGQSLSMVLSPTLPLSGFSVAERAAAALTGVTANGLYTAAAALLLWAGYGELPLVVRWLGGCVVVAGTALSVATLAQSGLGQTVAAGSLLPAVVLWCAATGRWLARESDVGPPAMR